MTISRWKIMAGMFGLSLAGIYAVAGPGSKGKAESKGDPFPAGTVVLSEPPLAPPSVVPVSGVIPFVPPAELVVPAAPTPEPTTLPLTLTLPADLPAPPPLVMSQPVIPLLPAPEPIVTSMPSSITLPRSTVESLPTPIVFELPAPPIIEVTPPPPLPATPEPAPSKYRIVLRVGDGEPVFEVRSGDNIVMKVISEKVDVKAPMEKGQTLSAVKAMGKVRFVGFGAEGCCDELSFLAGSGEVCLTGGVRVKVKDKLGRVESELTGEKMNYRLEAGDSSLSGVLEP